MTGIVTGPILDDRDLEAQGLSAIPTPVGAVFNPAADTRQLLRGEENSAATYGIADPERGTMLVPPEPTISADDASKQAEDQHLDLRFDNPVPQSVVDNLIQAKQDEATRAQALARRPSGIGSGLATAGVGLLGAALDPLNIATGFIPGVAEVRAGTLLGRAAIGAAAGAAQQVPLSALRYGLTKGEQGEYSIADVIADVAFSSILGGTIGSLHGGAGAVAEEVGQKALPEAAAVDSAPLKTRQGALQTSIAQMAEGRPVEVSPFFESSGGMFNSRFAEAERLAADPLAATPSLKEATVLPPETGALNTESADLAAHIQRMDPEAKVEPAVDYTAAYEQAASCVAME